MPSFIDKWSYLSLSSGLLEILPLEPRALKRFPLFKDLDFEQLHHMTQDVALVKWQDGAEIFHEGDYVDLAFFIVRGKIKLTTRAQSAQAQSAVFPFNFPQIEAASANLKMHIGEGDLFGEIGAVNGWPQPFTAVAECECELLQIRMAALRRLRAKSKPFGERVENEYGRQAVLWAMKQHKLFNGTNEMTLANLASQASFKSYDPGEVIARQDMPAQTLYLLRAGFCRLSRMLVENPVTLNYLSPGEVFGANEFLRPHAGQFAHTLSSYQYSDVIEIPYEAMREVLLHYFALNSRLHDCARELNEKYAAPEPLPTTKNLSLFQVSTTPRPSTLYDHERLARMEKIIDYGLHEGKNTMLIDLERCTHCNDCVRACADTHDDLPRFMREGKRVENWLVANSCRHCHDPLCLIGCPTGAIARRGADALVEIDENLCIGCKACATHCPFDAIMMHDTGDIWGGIDAPQANMAGKAKLVASKCDACAGKAHGPACVKACPAGCLVRVGNVRGFLEEY